MAGYYLVDSLLLDEALREKVLNLFQFKKSLIR